MGSQACTTGSCSTLLDEENVQMLSNFDECRGEKDAEHIDFGLVCTLLGCVYARTKQHARSRRL